MIKSTVPNSVLAKWRKILLQPFQSFSNFIKTATIRQAAKRYWKA